MRLKTAGEKAVQHPVWEQTGETDDYRGVATNRVARARLLAGDRVRDNSTCLFGRHSLRDSRLGLRSTLAERPVRHVALLRTTFQGYARVSIASESLTIRHP